MCQSGEEKKWPVSFYGGYSSIGGMDGGEGEFAYIFSKMGWPWLQHGKREACVVLKEEWEVGILLPQPLFSALGKNKQNGIVEEAKKRKG